MAELWDVAAHVESHPDDYAQRWRLAKKLYAAREYRLAIEHLNILKNEWEPKVNVRRYLAATYFRLGRYPEAIAELRESIKKWPDELGMREQLAYVLKADKRPVEALEAWEEVLRMQPDHAIAQKSARKLHAIIAGDAKNQDTDSKFEFALESDDDVPTPPPMPGMECPKCGAQNSEEFGDCWRCGAPLPHASFGIPQNAAFDLIEHSLPIRSETLGRVAVIATLAFLLYALFLGIRMILKYNEGTTELMSLSQLYSNDLVPSRIISGLVMLALWPVVLRIIIKIFRASPRPKATHVYIGGMFLGAFALVLMLAPIPATFLVPGGAILLFLALTVVMVAFQMRMSVALAVWATHFIVMCLIGLGVFWGTEIYRYGEMLHPVAEIATLQRFSRMPGDHANAKPVRLPTALTPIRNKAQWHSSGSTWLDSKVKTVTISLRLESEVSQLRFQIYENGTLRFHEDIGKNRNETFEYTITPESEYEFVVAGTDNLNVQAVIQSALPFDFLK